MPLFSHHLQGFPSTLYKKHVKQETLHLPLIAWFGQKGSKFYLGHFYEKCLMTAQVMIQISLALSGSSSYFKDRYVYISIILIIIQDTVTFDTTFIMFNIFKAVLLIREL